MKTLIGIFLSLSQKLPARILAALGITFISYAGVATAVGALASSFSSLWSGIPSDILSLLNMAGFGEALGIIIGAAIANASLTSIQKLGKLT